MPTLTDARHQAFAKARTEGAWTVGAFGVAGSVLEVRLAVLDAGRQWDARDARRASIAGIGVETCQILPAPCHKPAIRLPENLPPTCRYPAGRLPRAGLEAATAFGSERVSHSP